MCPLAGRAIGDVSADTEWLSTLLFLLFRGSFWDCRSDSAFLEEALRLGDASLPRCGFRLGKGLLAKGEILAAGLPLGLVGASGDIHCHGGCYFRVEGNRQLVETD